MDKDLTGLKFRKLTVIRYWGKIKSKKYWECLCDCGNLCLADKGSLVSGHKKSCGCIRSESMRKAKTKNLEGKIFGRLTPLYLDHYDKEYGALWYCECECGKFSLVRASALQNGSTQSCGCLQKERLLEANSLGYGESSINGLYCNYRAHARNRNLCFEIDLDLFKEITKKNCYYCGCAPFQIKKSKSNNGDYIYNGIDRIDSSKGYFPDNIVPCCGRCNVAKMNIAREEFLLWIDRVYQNIHRFDNIKEDYER